MTYHLQHCQVDLNPRLEDKEKETNLTGQHEGARKVSKQI